MLESKENAIEWIYGDKRATSTLCSPKHVNTVKRLAEKYPDECEIAVENKDGSVVFHCPVKWIRFQRPNAREITEEEREIARQRLLELRENGKLQRND